MNKKILIGAGIVTLLIIVGGILFLMRGGDGEGGGLSNLFPFGQSGDSPILPQNPGTMEQTDTGGIPSIIQDENGLRKLSGAPVSGAFFANAATGTVVRFIERATGHIFEAEMESGSISRITNTTIPKIESVAWGIGGETLIAQYREDEAIASVVLEIVTPTGTTTEEFARVDEFRLPDNILFPSFSPSGDAIFYLTKLFGGGVEGIVSEPRGGEPKAVWQFPTTEWISQWPQENLVTLTSKAGNGIPGAMYSVNPSTGASTLALGGILGLTTNTSPSGELTLYSTSEGRSLGTYIWNRAENTSSRLSVETLAEKCAWSSDENTVYCAEAQTKSPNAPDDWYQGLASYDDALIRINLLTGDTETVSSLTTSDGKRIDVVNPKISADDNYLLFMNKKDLSLWALPL